MFVVSALLARRDHSTSTTYLKSNLSKMDKINEYRFHIQAYTPETLPMSRLAEYMSDLARLIGEQRNVHFARLDPGSAVIVHWVEPDVVAKVQARVSLARQGVGPAEPLRAIQNINAMLEEDGGTGFLETGSADVIHFPSRGTADAVLIGPLSQPTMLEGVVIRVGGTKEMVPIHLAVEGGSVQSRCYASRDTAKLLARHIFGPELRLTGPGLWLRTVKGRWVLDRFTVHSFDVLERRPLAEELAGLRALDNGWLGVADPWAELFRIRHGDEEP